jgi:hypothetical protein
LGIQKDIYGIFIDFFYGISVEFLWDIFDISIGFLWDFRDMYFWNFYGISMELL